jgi:putative restriction endonuclease
MTDLTERFSKLKVSVRGQETSVHKPLLVLYALGQLYGSKRHMLPYEEIDRQLSRLLSDHGPSRKTIHTVYPFWRLQNDGIWTVDVQGGLKAHDKKMDPRKTELIAVGATGGFVSEIYEGLCANPDLILTIARGLATKYFAETNRAKVLASVGLH